MTNLVLLAYGRATEYRRAIFAALSFWAWRVEAQADVRAIIFTDEPAFFQPYLQNLPVVYELLTPARLAAMQGLHHYIHRVKAEIIGQVFRQYPADNVLFFDSDTFFAAEPGPVLAGLAAGHTYMHLREYTLAAAVNIYAGFGQAEYPRQLLEVLASRRFEVGGRQVQFQPAQYNWNSGVLGLPAAVAGLLPDVCALMDALYAGSGWFTSEQIAFSLALQAQGPVLPSQAYVYHYWEKQQKVLADSWLEKLVTADFSGMPLAGQLAQVRRLVPQWHRQLELHKAQEAALYSFAHGQLQAGLKCTAKALLAGPPSGKFMKEIYRVLRQRAH